MKDHDFFKGLDWSSISSDSVHGPPFDESFPRIPSGSKCSILHWTKCIVCGFSPAGRNKGEKKYKLLKHRRSTLKHEVSVSKTGDLKFKCSDCSIFFNRSDHVILHQKTVQEEIMKNRIVKSKNHARRQLKTMYSSFDLPFNY